MFTHEEILNIYEKIGISGKPLGATQPMMSEFNETAGIYGWVVDNQIVYVGKTENFKNRMVQHIADLNGKSSSTAKYNKGIGPHLVDVIILFEMKEIDQTLLSVAEQIAITACGGVGRLWNGRNETTMKRVVENIRRN